MGKRLVLLIDANVPGLYIRQHVLQASGYDVITVKSLEEAQRVCEAKPDAIVAVLPLSDSEALATASELRKRVPGVPFIAAADAAYQAIPPGLCDKIVLRLDGPRTLLNALAEVLPPFERVVAAS